MVLLSSLHSPMLFASPKILGFGSYEPLLPLVHMRENGTIVLLVCFTQLTVFSHGNWTFSFKTLCFWSLDRAVLGVKW